MGTVFKLTTFRADLDQMSKVCLGLESKEESQRKRPTTLHTHTVYIYIYIHIINIYI